ncbi:MAG: Fpg/Nei family DNA glycosylase, partial [Planctomycetota bacterium]
GAVLESTDAHGKHLFYLWTRDRVVHVHLGLYGKFRVHRNPAPQPRGAVRVRMIGDDKTFDLNGPNCCELIGHDEYEAIRKRLGQDPLRTDADPEKVWAKISSSRSTIGSMMMNQSVIAGVGNIYRAEILFLLGINPERPANEVSRQEFNRMWELTVELLQLGMKHNRIITNLSMSGGKSLGRLRAGDRLNIYKKPVCPRCEADVYYWESANRTVYACDRCQV